MGIDSCTTFRITLGYVNSVPISIPSGWSHGFVWSINWDPNTFVKQQKKRRNSNPLTILVPASSSFQGFFDDTNTACSPKTKSPRISWSSILFLCTTSRLGQCSFSNKLANFSWHLYTALFFFGLFVYKKMNRLMGSRD